MNAHQKATIGNFLIKKTMGLYYKVPEDLDRKSTRLNSSH